MSETVDRLRDATRGTEYEGRLFLVGGVPRDRYLGLPETQDVDLVTELDALALADLLYRKGLSDHRPVTYERFGTAKIAVAGGDVELVSARAESYDSASRKPDVKPATLKDDVFRRDFTINTLLENLHTGETLDLTGRAISDLTAGIIRTPLEPKITFHDDPLRMLRAIRFAVRFGFEIEEATWKAISAESHRLNLMGPALPVVSAERIRDEFTKIIMTATPEPIQNPKSNIQNPIIHGLVLMKDSGLLAQFIPELLESVGVTQNAWHRYDVWDHTMEAMRNLSAESGLETRLGLLFHDIGKPRTRSEDDRGIHFYEHQSVGGEMTREIMRRLKFTNEQIRDVSAIVELHMRLGESRPDWSDAAVKRLIRATAEYREELFEVGRCDMAAMDPDVPKTDLAALRERMNELERQADIVHLQSPLDGTEIMEALGIPPGPLIRGAKDFLTNEVIEGRLTEEDKDSARTALLSWHQTIRNPKSKMQNGFAP